MVKNYGGNKSKKMGRKFVNQPRDRKVRFAEEVEEQYAVVTKLFGNGMAEVKCIDNVTRLCVFRKKFKGRSKRDNMVSMGTVVLIGVRSWEVIAADSKKLENCVKRRCSLRKPSLVIVPKKHLIQFCYLPLKRPLTCLFCIRSSSLRKPP